MVDFGWSATCVLEAIKLSIQIRKALKESGGAKDQYAEAMSFLTQFECVFKELERLVQDDPNSVYRLPILQQLKLMESPWTRLQGMLSKYEKSLGDTSTRSKFKTWPRKGQWGVVDLNEAVRKEKNEILSPLKMVDSLLQMQSMSVAGTLAMTSLLILSGLQYALSMRNARPFRLC